MIIVRLKGGLGNQMFQYALGRVLALKNNQELFLDLSYFQKKAFTPREYYLDKFNIKAKISESTKIPFLIKYFLPLLKKINWFGNIYLDGYFQSEKYFKKYTQNIIEDLSFKKPSIQSENIIKEMESSNSVCLHIRRGDYVGNKLHPLQDFAYYENGVKELEKKIKIDKIYVFSDDVTWCKENIKFKYELIIFNKKDLNITDEEELNIMTYCKYFIIANSSFSWWAAWLSRYKEKIVIAPKKWFADTSIDTKDLIPESWIRI